MKLAQYVDGVNKWLGLFGEGPLSLDNPQDRQAIADRIASDLSPENLTCDGELSMSQVEYRRALLEQCLSELREIDSTVSVNL